VESQFNLGEKVIAIIGGTGKEGSGLAYRWTRAGLKVIIGSRKLEKAQKAVEELLKLTGEDIDLTGMENIDAARKADIVVLTVPYEFHRSTLESIKPVMSGKIFIDVSVPIIPPQVTKVQMPPSGSALQEAKEILGDQVKVASAFQNVSYTRLLKDEDVGCDILVCGEGRETREIVLELVAKAGLVGWDAGPINNSMVVEGLTSILIGINKRFKVQGSGIRITNVDRE
jgi:NADPH-dependent F420 reductase